MANVTVRDLRNQRGRVLERVAAGESLTVTMDDRPIAELRRLPGLALSADTLLARWRNLPVMDADLLRKDIDRTLDSFLTCNPADFNDMAGLDVIAVPVPRQR